MLAPRFQHLSEIERRRIIMPADVRMRLNRLEKPESWPDDLQAEIMATFRPDQIQQYPAYSAFYDRLGRFFDLDPAEIVVGAGIEEHIRSLFMLCTEPGDKVAVLWPTCAMFEIYARAFGIELVKIVTAPGNPLLIANLPDDLKLFIMANPGQPVETCFGWDGIQAVAQECAEKGAVLAIDEAYYGFGAPTMLGMHAECDNVVILRTFSKAFGAASIRLGFAVAGPKLKGALDAVRQSGEVSAFSMHVATVLMDNFDAFVAPSIERTIDGRDQLRDRVMTDLGLQAWGNFANHVLIELPDAAGVADRLAARGILVKANFPVPLDSHMLVTCGGSALMESFFYALRASL